MKRESIVLIALFVFLISFLGLGCSDDGDSRKVTKELEEQLTESLDFQGGEVVDGPPPAEHAGDSNYPQVTVKSAPSSLEVGQSFTIELQTDFGDLGRILGAIVHVGNADKHIRIEAYVSEDGVMTLEGSLDFDSEMSGLDYVIRLAMMDMDGEVGNYAEWDLSLPKLKDSKDSNYTPTGYGYCNDGQFDCSTSQSQTVIGQWGDYGTCSQDCQVYVEDTENPDVEGYSSCISCCNLDFAETVDRSRFVECFACMLYTYDDSGDMSTPEAARGEAADMYDSISSETEACVR